MGLPPFLKNSQRVIYGWRLPEISWGDDSIEFVERIRGLPIRNDDILIASYPKCGTHWVWEVTNMLVKQTVEYDKRTKNQMMLEFFDPVGRLEKEISPRVLSSHFVINHLPQEMFSKKTKIIHLVRNPKDTLVSMYHFYSKNLAVPPFTLSEFLTEAIADNLSLPSQFDFLRQITEFELSHPDHPIKHIQYEDMKRDPLKTILDLAQFLNVSASETFCQQIAEACSFDSMKRNDDAGNKEVPHAPEEMLKQFTGKKVWLFRKGIIGDWKNELTEEQVQELDEYIDREEKKGLAFKFVYE